MPFCTFELCENFTEGSTLFCASHNQMFRKADRDLKKLESKKVHRIAKVSAKKADKLKSYPALRAKYLKENPVCEVHFSGCTGLSEEIHHCSTSELDFLNVKTWKAVCRHDHNIIERKISAERRRELGLLI